MGFGGMASFQLAMQQGLFAIDDFMSSTGGIEFKLRAIGNNISQLGLNIGQSGLIPGLTATGGLFLGMGTMMLAHTIPALLKYANIIEDDAIPAGDILNESLKRQESRSSESYKELGKSLRQLGMSGEGLKGLERSETLEDLATRSIDAPKEQITMFNPEVIKSKQRQASLEKRLSESPDLNKATVLKAALNREKQKEADLIKNSKTLTIGEAMDSIKGSRGGFDEAVSALRSSALGAGMTGGGVGGFGGPIALSKRNVSDLSLGDLGDTPEQVVEQMREQLDKVGSELLREMKHGDGGRALDKLVEGFTSMEEAAGQLRLAIANSLVASRKEIGKAAFAVEDNLQKSQEIIESLEGKTPEQKRKIAELSGSANETAKRVAELGATNIQGTDKAAEIGKAIADEMTKAQNINKQAIAMQEAQKKQEIFAERKERGKEFLRPDSFDTPRQSGLKRRNKGLRRWQEKKASAKRPNKLAEGVAPMRDQFAAEQDSASCRAIETAAQRFGHHDNRRAR